MRFVRLVIAGSPPATLVFRKGITVVGGLPHPHREQLRRALRSLAQGRVEGIDAMVELDGALIQLSADLASGLPLVYGDLDPVLGPVVLLDSSAASPAEAYPATVSAAPATVAPEVSNVSIQAALEVLGALEPDATTPVERSLQVADRLRDVRAARRDLEFDNDSELTDRAHQLQSQIHEIDELLRQVDELRSKIEVAHAEVVDAEEKSKRRMAGPPSFNRLVAARHHENDLLAQLGYPDYLTYQRSIDLFIAQQSEDRTLIADQLATVNHEQRDNAAGRVKPELAILRAEESVLNMRLQLVEQLSASRAASRDEAEWFRQRRMISAQARRALEILVQGGSAERLPEGTDVRVAALSLLAQQTINSASPAAATVLTEVAAPVELNPAVLADLAAVPAAMAELRLLSRLRNHDGAPGIGSMPALLDDLLLGQPEPNRDRILPLLAKISERVQLLYLTDDPHIAAWAASLPDPG